MAAALGVGVYNPDLDPDGRDANQIVRYLPSILEDGLFRLQLGQLSGEEASLWV